MAQAPDSLREAPSFQELFMFCDGEGIRFAAEVAELLDGPAVC